LYSLPLSMQNEMPCRRVELPGARGGVCV
jgi:hypothetical protein